VLDPDPRKMSLGPPPPPLPDAADDSGVPSHSANPVFDMDGGGGNSCASSPVNRPSDTDADSSTAMAVKEAQVANANEKARSEWWWVALRRRPRPAEDMTDELALFPGFPPSHGSNLQGNSTVRPPSTRPLLRLHMRVSIMEQEWFESRSSSEYVRQDRQPRVAKRCRSDTWRGKKMRFARSRNRDESTREREGHLNSFDDGLPRRQLSLLEAFARRSPWL